MSKRQQFDEPDTILRIAIPAHRVKARVVEVEIFARRVGLKPGSKEVVKMYEAMWGTFHSHERGIEKRVKAKITARAIR